MEILHKTKLNSVDYLYGNSTTLTEDADRKRTRVGIGETIELEIKDKKEGAKGKEENVIWEITEGDAYLSKEGSVIPTDGKKVFEKAYKVNLNIRVSGATTYMQKVKVKVTTTPIQKVKVKVETPNGDVFVDKDEECAPETAILTFDRYRPTFHDPSRPPFTQPNPNQNIDDAYGLVIAREVSETYTGEKNMFESTNAEASAKRLIGAYATLLVIPTPTFVNFGGKAEGGVYIREFDANPNKQPLNVQPPIGSIFAGRIHNINAVFGKINENGSFFDDIGITGKAYKKDSSGTIIPWDDKVYDSILLNNDNSCYWLCDSKYKARIQEDDKAIYFIRGAKQTFLIKAGVANSETRGLAKIKKFGVTVSRSLTQDVNAQTITREWWPFSDKLPPMPKKTPTTPTPPTTPTSLKSRKKK